MKAKIRNAMVTWNNPPTREWDDLVAMLNPAYMVGQLERGENGTLHWQFAIQWSHSAPSLLSRRTCLWHTSRRSVMGGSRPVLPEGGL